MRADTSAPSHADGAIYRSARLAAGYASARPPLHPHVLRIVAARLRLDAAVPLRRALDVGCGAGLSTAALKPFARQTVGVEPAVEMLVASRSAAPRSSFVGGRAEALPFPSSTFDLVTAAGALNYADRPRALDEIARVLAPRGRLVVYDFSGGRRLRGSAALDEWWEAFEQRYPYPGGYAMETALLDYRRARLRLLVHERFTIWLPFGVDDYLRYVLSETNVERALAEGEEQAAIAGWCRATLQPTFADGPIDIGFDGYATFVERIAGKERR